MEDRGPVRQHKARNPPERAVEQGSLKAHREKQPESSRCHKIAVGFNAEAGR